MGLFFSNVHVKKNDGFTNDNLIAMLIEDMINKGYKKVITPEDGEVEMVIYCPMDSEWISVASDMYDFGNESDTRGTVESISKKLGTYVIAEECIDSDYAYMHLVGSNDGTDGWINSGKPYDEMKLIRRTSIAQWKNVVNDFDSFKAMVKEKYDFAEDMFCNIAENLGMKPEQSLLEVSNSKMLDEKFVTRLFFSAPKEIKKELPVLKITTCSLTPCVPNMNQVVFVNNKGGRSKGIAIIFVGDYIENDEIEIYDATFESDYGGDKCKKVPIHFTKCRAQNGKTMLWWENKDFQIPPAINPNLPLMKRTNLEFKKQFGIRFFVRGNERKFLDIKVFIIPLENYQEGADCWYVYKSFGTKRDYVEWMVEQAKENLSRFTDSERKKKIEANPHMYFSPDKYDLD